MSEKVPDDLAAEQVHAIRDGNAAGWDVVGRTKYRDGFARALEGLKKGKHPFSEHELIHLRSLCQGSNRAIQLCCANGRSALSLLALGAQEAVGVDISQEMIALARELTVALEAPATWYCCDVLETPHELDSTADLVYTGGGAMNWVTDIDAWAAVIYRLLRPGGTLFLFENHPLNYVWDYEAADYTLAPGPDYCDGGFVVNRSYPATEIARYLDVEDRPVIHDRVWPLGHVINAVIKAGLVLRHFQEFADRWIPFENMSPEVHRRLPHGYMLIADKPAHAK
ncbi:MAG: methyltransferase domain-containing protein [Candidatus Latescibacteria bacterium]|nr:methyltransferase domain-containing protein [Candidatus Latescibacterota bacterium]